MPTRVLFAGPTMAVFFFLASPAGAEQKPDNSAYSFPLFDGESLDGWTVQSPCTVDVRDGLMRLEAGTGWIRSDEEFSDFALHFEWRALGGRNGDYDSGVFIRAGREGRPFPRSGYQINLRRGHEGEVIGLAGTNAGQTAMKPPGHWNAFDVTVRGDRIALRINERQAYDVGGLKQRRGHIGFQVEVPEGGPFEIRNVRMTEFGYRGLFVDGDLSRWHAVGGPSQGNWDFERGWLISRGKNHAWLRSKDQYDDFNLRLQYQVSEGANSGVYVRVPADGTHHRENGASPPAGFEVQILDDAAPRYATLKDYQYSASVYDIAGAKPRVSKPNGRWNSLEIDCRGQHVAVTHNGVRVVDVDARQSPLLALRSARGYLGLQSHNGLVRFRNVRIGPPAS